MSIRRSLVGGAAVVTLAIFGSSAGQAQTAKQIESQMQTLQAQIQSLQSQLQSLQGQVQSAQAQAQAAKEAAAAGKGSTPAGNAPKVTETRNHHFGLSSADGRNTVELTGRLNVDVGDYLHYAPNAGTVDKQMAAGINLRRARIGVTGVWEEDFRYALIYDFGGSSDSLNPNNAFANGNSGTSPTTSNSALSGVENAFITYNGLYQHGQQFPIAIDFGIMDVPWTMDEATSSNDIMFMERSSSQVVATAFGGGDSRSAFGVRSNDKNYWIGAYLTGPQSGALHTDGASCVTAAPIAGTPCVAAASGHGPQFSFLARGAYTFEVAPDLQLHIGANFADLFRPRGSGNAATITLSDRPELRIDPSVLLTTGAIPSTGGFVEGGEAAVAWDHLFVQGEYYHYSVDRTAPLTNLSFNGGYGQASWTFGGKRVYNPAQGAWTGVVPDAPLAWNGSGWGALEVGVRYSIVDLNSGNPLACAGTCLIGGEQTTYGIGINYYPNYNMRFMFDYEHGNLNKPGVGAALPTGAKFDWIAARAQIQF